jgi:hypothetical protein
MPVAVAARRRNRYRAVFPDWHAPRPVGWFFMEQLLEARAASAHPTNGHRPDEDVNVYLAHLLEGLVAEPRPAGLAAGATPLWQPPHRSLARRVQAARYRANGDHRLLCLGLFDRGDLLRRRAVPWGRDPRETRDHDLETGRRCYGLAANLLAGRGGAQAGLVPVLEKLAEGFAEYVQVLAVLGRRRLGLGAVLGEAELAGMLRGPAAAARGTTSTMDDLLDLLNVWRTAPEPELARRIRTLAVELGVDPARLGAAAAG